MKKFDIYTKNGCGWCEQAKQLLQSKGYSFTEHRVGVNTTKDQIQARVNSLGLDVQIRTVPQIFLIEQTGDTYIGGYEDLNSKVNTGAV